MERKSDAVRRLVAEGNFKDALRIAKSFRSGITKSDSDDMKRGYESMFYPNFYRSIGQDPAQITLKAISTVIRLYGNQFTTEK